MVCSQWGIVETPVLQIVEIPPGHWQMGGDLHPMSLGLEVTMHRGDLEA
jgi:hypothetical protein